MKVFTTHLDHNLVVMIIKIRIKEITRQQYRHKTVKDFLLFQKFKWRVKRFDGWNRRVDDDVDKYKLVFIGSNRETFNFNIFNWLLAFLSAIYNGELSLKEAEISQREIRKK